MICGAHPEHKVVNNDVTMYIKTRVIKQLTFYYLPDMLICRC